MKNGKRHDRLGAGRTWSGSLGLMLLALGLSLPAGEVRAQRYGSNFGWSYSTPRTTYYNGPAVGLVGPYGYGYGYGGGGNVQYFRRGRNAFAVETYRDRNGRLRQRTGVFYSGGR